MTRHATGMSESIAARRVECEQAIGQLCAARPVEPASKTKIQAVNAHVITRLRRQLGDDLADLVISVAALQTKAQRKLAPPCRDSPIWWVTKKSLQQATAWQVARLKSSWLDHRLVYDLCCGIGGDAIHLAKRGPLVAVDSDRLLVEMAAANLHRSGATSDHAHARCGDAAEIEIPKHAWVHMDPDRRADGNRTSSPDFYLPSWSQVSKIVGNLDGGMIKLAPAAKLDSEHLDRERFGDTHRCWISLAGSVREQTLLCGRSIELANGTSGQDQTTRLKPGAKSAVALCSDGSPSWFIPRSDEIDAVSTDVSSGPLSILVDPDASVRAAGLTEAFARHYGLQRLGKASGFLTSADALAPAAEKLAVTGNVIWFGSCDDRKLRRELRSRGVYPRIIKVRGTDHDPAALAKRYRKCGEQPVTLWIGRTRDRVYAAITNEGCAVDRMP